jgi:23S rRNA (cytidine1920-2'-O)/16S rRNA (cytidine1409-2'-O)-methyltransferase
VSFISLTKVLPPILQFLSPGALIIALVKPQFEVGKGRVGRGGVVREEAQRREVLQRIIRFATEAGLETTKTIDCPIRGKKGNREILSIFKFNGSVHGM